MFLFTSSADRVIENSIKVLVNKISEDFNQFFLEVYSNELILSQNINIQASETSSKNLINSNKSFKLQSAPVRSSILKSGELLKQGALLSKAWRKRYFVVNNASLNFRVDYFESECGRLKGSIGGSGYLVAKFDSSDLEQYGPHGLKLVPFQPSRRTWFFRCQDDVECTEWLQVLQFACHKADSDDDPDKIFACSFKKAFELLRCKYDFTLYYKDYGKEAERMSDFMRQVVNRDLKLKKTDDSVVEKLATSAASNLLSTIKVEAIARETMFKNLSEEATQEIKMKSKSMKKEIQTTIQGSVDGLLSKHRNETFRPILDLMLDPITQAFTQSIKSTFAVLSSKLVDNEFETKEKKVIALNELVKNLDLFWLPESLSYSPAQILMSMFNDQSLDIVFFEACCPASSLSRMCLDIIISLIHQTVHTFGSSETEETSFSKLNNSIINIIRSFIHDARIHLHKTLILILQLLLRKSMLMMLESHRESLKSLVEQLKSSETKNEDYFVNVNCIALEYSQVCVNDCIESFIKPYLVDCSQSLDAVESELSGLSPNESSVKASRDTAKLRNSGKSNRSASPGPRSHLSQSLHPLSLTTGNKMSFKDEAYDSSSLPGSSAPSTPRMSMERYFATSPSVHQSKDGRESPMKGNSQRHSRTPSARLIVGNR